MICDIAILVFLTAGLEFVDRDEDLYRHLIVTNFAEELVRHIRWILSLSIKFSSHIKIKIKLMFTYLKRSNIFTIYINLLLVEYIYSYFRISIMTLFLLQIGILRLSFYEGKKKTYHPTSILPWHYSILAVGVNNPQ
jgi:hypothetical protein